MQRTRFSEREPLAEFGPYCPCIWPQHHRLSRRRRLKSTTMDSVFKETSEHLFLSCSLTVPVYHLMVKLFYHSCAKYSGYVNVFRPVVSDLALRKANDDETVQWPPRRFARQNEPSPPPSHLHRPLSGHQPGELRPLAPPVNAVSCLRPFQTFFRLHVGCW